MLHKSGSWRAFRLSELDGRRCEWIVIPVGLTNAVGEVCITLSGALQRVKCGCERPSLVHYDPSNRSDRRGWLQVKIATFRTIFRGEVGGSRNCAFFGIGCGL